MSVGALLIIKHLSLSFWKGGGGGSGGAPIRCFFGLQVDGLITERVYKREEKEKLLSGS